MATIETQWVENADTGERSLIRQIDTGNGGPDLWACEFDYARWSDGSPVGAQDCGPITRHWFAKAGLVVLDPLQPWFADCTEEYPS